MIKYERSPEGGILCDGSLTVFRSSCPSGDAYATFALERSKKSSSDQLVLCVPIRVIVTGNLAFYACVLGKEYGDQHW